MALSRRAATIMVSVASMAADVGPQIPHYAIPLDLPRLFKWVPGDTSTVDSITVIGHTGGTVGRWLQVRYDNEGDDLTDASATIGIGDGEVRRLPISTLSVNRVITLSNTNATTGDVITIVRIDAEAFTLQVDDGFTANTITTLPASERWFADFRFGATFWQLLRAGQMP